MTTNNPDYQKNYIRQHYQNNKEYYKRKAKERNARVKAYTYKLLRRYKKLKGCVDCGYNHNPIALQFDHVYGNKHLSISAMVGRGYSIPRIKEEVRKCEIRCANCHVIRTSYSW